MKKYFYTNGINNFGPYTLEELGEMNITRDTRVWYKELGEWNAAGSILELNEIFESTPPIDTPNNSSYMENMNTQRPPKSWLVESILVTLFCCLPFGIAGIVNAARVESRFYAGDFQGAMRASTQARTWTTVSFFIGLFSGIIYLIVLLVGRGISGF
ncbi:MAG TPA: hypothetical protein DCL77_01655 [Prolixibacteraceae bacterium]|nr:hypothetical protein [Prolixibacteraceae bacterium]